jgi:hypothetical protein
MGAAERAAAAAPAARHPLVERILAPDAPEALRLSAARGALPLPVADLVEIQVRLLADAGAGIAAAARDSLGRVGHDALPGILRDPHCAPAVLDHFASLSALTEECLAILIAHPALADATLVELATRGDSVSLNLIVTNESRVVTHPPLLAALRANPRLSPADRRRLAELDRDLIQQTAFRTSSTPVATPAATPVPDAVPDPAAAAIPGATDALPEGMEPPPDGAVPETEPFPEEISDEALQRTDAYQRIMRLNVAERQLLAMKGSGEERAILIRDTSRMVSMSVLKNPRLSDTEITRYAAMRNLHEDILRQIAKNREWTKTYAVVLNLAKNPKTPPGLTLQFLARLGTRDLKIIAGDKNVAELVRRNARNMFQVRTQPPKAAYKKAH